MASSRSIFVVCLLLSTALILVIPSYVPVVHATGANVHQWCHNYNGAPTTKLNCSGGGGFVGTWSGNGLLATGDLIVLLYQMAYSGTSPVLLSVNDTVGSTFTTPVCSSESAGSGAVVCVAYGYALSGETSVSERFSGSSGAASIDIDMWDVTNPPVSSAICIKTGSSASTTNLGTSGNCPNATDDVLLFGACSGTQGVGVCARFTPMTGTTLFSTYHWTDNQIEGCVDLGGVANGFTNGCNTVSSPTNFTGTISGSYGGWAEVGFDLLANPPVPPVTVTAINYVAPSPFSLNYWMFPLLFLGMYDSLYFVTGALAKVSTKGLIYLMLSGFVMGSIVGVLMGFLGIQMVVLCLLSLMVWWWRFH